MTYAVAWLPDAEQELAAIYMNASDPSAISQASNLIDYRLARNPAQEGESRPNGRRILLVSPLGVIFRVSEDDRLVTVSHVWTYGWSELSNCQRWSKWPLTGISIAV